MAAKKEDEGYKLKLTGTGHNFERTITEDIATKIITFVMGGADISGGSVGGGSGGAGGGSDSLHNRPQAGSAASGAQLTPKQFIAQKRPGNNYERVACLGYYLTHYRDTPHFKTSDITKLNTESAHNFSNPAVFVMHATGRYNYLAAAGGGKKQITSLGEALVEALPDRAKVAEALAEHKPRKMAKRKKKTK
jgi:hypothetical protein